MMNQHGEHSANSEWQPLYFSPFEDANQAHNYINWPYPPAFAGGEQSYLNCALGNFVPRSNFLGTVGMVDPWINQPDNPNYNFYQLSGVQPSQMGAMQSYYLMQGSSQAWVMTNNG